MPDHMQAQRHAAVIATIRLIKRLCDYYTSDELSVWLESPQPLLENALPAELIASGRVEEIHRLFDQMDAGAYI